MSFNKPSMNGLNNFNVDEIETLITNNTLASKYNVKMNPEGLSIMDPQGSLENLKKSYA